jgi:glutamine---fructose-6-phosphate transaminase (isomerizing)
MCNLAGYIGKKRAAPVLLKMIKDQEGFGGGYYTGIVTLHEGELYWRKVVGDCDELIKQTDALDLPGTIGIIHSRSNGFGDVEWAHPFLNPEESIAYILNGHMGSFYEDKVNERKIMMELIANGYKFKSMVPKFIPDMFQFDDGCSIHTSEARCFLVDHMRKTSGSWSEALIEASNLYPSETVGLLLCAENPDSIHATRFNQPLMIGRSADTTLLSSTALVFPDNLDSIIQAPIRSVMKFNKDSFEVHPLNDTAGPVADIFPMAAGYKKIEAMLSENDGHSFTDFKNATAELWPKNMAPQKDMMVYEIIRLLRQEGKIIFRDFQIIKTTSQVIN